MMKDMTADQAETFLKKALQREFARKEINCYDRVVSRESDGKSGTLVYRITGFKKSLVICWDLTEMTEKGNAEG